MTDEARKMVLDNHIDALVAAERWALASNTTAASNLVLSLFFNLTNDFGKKLSLYAYGLRMF
jgi:hypothetical protein